MAEILLSLTIIGVVAAITLPSLTGNINERTWNTQRKALYARMSQAIALMPAINGYGTFAAATTSTSAIDNVAETFITSGLAKVLKINNICSPSNVTDCGFTSQQITNGAGSKMDLPEVLTDLNNGIAGSISGTTMTIKNTKAAAFETANGESILTFYNPECMSENVLIPHSSTGTGDFFIKQQVCVNFVFDLNGKNGPNTFGKDIGIITVVYPSDSKVVMPMYPRSAATGKTYTEATHICKGLSDGEYRLPNLEEMISIYYNKFLVGGDVLGAIGNMAWTTSTIDSNTVYAVGQAEGVKYSVSKLSSRNVACVQR
ncbi:MAG: type II secretion system GspH family protein [Fusobacterium sp.]|nr:type II secretion system GspH family protein [Fusobacterium sp.]